MPHHIMKPLILSMIVWQSFRAILYTYLDNAPMILSSLFFLVMWLGLNILYKYLKGL